MDVLIISRSLLKRVGILYFTALVLLSCGDGEPKVKKVDPKYNYTILLDLSDRILKEGQVTRDTTIISGLYDVFLEKLQEELYYNTKDEFKILIANQKDQFPDNKIFDIEDTLYVNMETVPMRDKVKYRDSKKEYLNKVADLYDLARISEFPNDYKGANILGYLKNGLINDRIEGDNTRNFLFIITDGYQYVEGTKFRSIDRWPEVTDLSDISVAVMELDPTARRGDTELDRIKNAWEDWLERMNVENVLLLNKQKNATITKQLKAFIKKQPNGIKKSEIRQRSTNNILKEVKTPVSNNSLSSTASTKKKEVNKVTVEKDFSNIMFTSKGQDLEAATISISSHPSPKSKKKIFYADLDADGLGDPNNSSLSDYLPTNYVITAGDNCPTRKGASSNGGCPILTFTPKLEEAFINEKIIVSLDGPANKGDTYKWSCSSCKVATTLTNTSSESFIFSKLGKARISATVSNMEDNYKETIFVELAVKISRKLLKEYLDNIIQSEGLNKDDSVTQKVQLVESLASSDCTVVDSKKGFSIVGDGALSSFLLMAQQPNITIKLPILKPENFTVSTIIYEKQTGLIRQIQL